MVEEVHPTRDYSERMLAAFGWPVAFGEGWARLSGGHRLHAGEVVVPADFSSAAFFLVAASLVPGSVLTLRDVGLNPRRTGLLDVLRRMGADIRQQNRRQQGGEVLADLVVRHAPLHGIDVPVDRVPDMIDEFPALFIAAAVAGGTTRVRGAGAVGNRTASRRCAGLGHSGWTSRKPRTGPDRGGTIRAGAWPASAITASPEFRRRRPVPTGRCGSTTARISPPRSRFGACANACGFRLEERAG